MKTKLEWELVLRKRQQTYHFSFKIIEINKIGKILIILRRLEKYSFQESTGLGQKWAPFQNDSKGENVRLLYFTLMWFENTNIIYFNLYKLYKSLR